MKRILLACFLLTATCTVTYNEARAQSAAVSVTIFTEKVNLMDSYLAAGNLTAATTTWNEIHALMMQQLGYTKSVIAAATTESARVAALAVNNNQVDLYQQVWALKTDLTTNRAAIRTKLLAFAATF